MDDLSRVRPLEKYSHMVIEHNHLLIDKIIELVYHVPNIHALTLSDIKPLQTYSLLSKTTLGSLQN